MTPPSALMEAREPRRSLVTCCKPAAMRSTLWASAGVTRPSDQTHHFGMASHDADLRLPFDIGIGQTATLQLRQNLRDIGDAAIGLQSDDGLQGA